MQVTQTERYPSSSADIDHCSFSPRYPPSVTTRLTSSRDELVDAFRAGSNVAFEEVQRRYSLRLYKQIVCITRSHEDAEDALQDTFFRAFLARESFEGRSHVYTWLTRIAINSALVVVRRRHAKVWVSLTRPPESGANAFEIRDSAPSPEKICDLKQRVNELSGAIERLDLISRAVIENLITNEGSMKELANSLNFTVGQVKTRLYRARKKLAKNVDRTRRQTFSPGLDCCGVRDARHENHSSVALKSCTSKAIE